MSCGPQLFVTLWAPFSIKWCPCAQRKKRKNILNWGKLKLTCLGIYWTYKGLSIYLYIYSVYKPFRMWFLWYWTCRSDHAVSGFPPLGDGHVDILDVYGCQLSSVRCMLMWNSIKPGTLATQMTFRNSKRPSCGKVTLKPPLCNWNRHILYLPPN